MAPSYIASAIAIISTLLEVLGIHVGNDALQVTVTTIIQIIVPLIVMARQLVNNRSTMLGTKPASLSTPV